MHAPQQTQSTQSSVDIQLKQARQALQSGAFDEAARLADLVVQSDKAEGDALYILAVAHRLRGRFKEALTVLSRLQEVWPDYGRAFQEEGHCHRDMGDLVAAAKSYERAVAANPALTASWVQLAELYRQHQEMDAAKTAARQVDYLSSLPRELVSVTSFIHEGRLQKAELLCRAFLQKNPHHIEAMRLLADIGNKLHILDDAEFLLESCVELAPDNRRARFDYVNLLNKRQKYEKALGEAKRLRQEDVNNIAFETVYANQCLAVGDFDEALAVYDDVLEKTPEATGVLMARGHALKTIGKQDEAVSSYRRSYEVKPDHGDAFWSLANLKTYRFSDKELAQMKAEEQKAGIRLEDRFHLCFALGKALEDRGDYEASFAYYERGNALKKAQLRYRADRMDVELQAQADHCTADLFEKQKGTGHDAPDPIFIVGLPRAGSTLLEQILASHSQVDGTLELPNILALAHRLNGRRRVSEDARYPRILHELEADKLTEFGKAYIEDTRIYRKGAPFFTDKMPNNFRHIGLIHLILPNAKIIDARRGAMACCFSNFKQLFAEGQEFTYGLEEIGRYYRGYVDLMDHWDKVLPGKVLRVQYEDVVADTKTQVRRILDFCGLPFEQQCLEFHKTERSVRTASSEQVRQPIYKQGLEQWRNYEPWLYPLKGALQGHL